MGKTVETVRQQRQESVQHSVESVQYCVESVQHLPLCELDLIVVRPTFPTKEAAKHRCQHKNAVSTPSNSAQTNKESTKHKGQQGAYRVLSNFLYCVPAPRLHVLCISCLLSVKVSDTIPLSSSPLTAYCGEVDPTIYLCPLLSLLYLEM